MTSQSKITSEGSSEAGILADSTLKFVEDGNQQMNQLLEAMKMIDETTSEVVWPLPPGNYVARLMKDDGYDSLAESAAFVIR